MTKTQFRIGLAGSMALAALAWVATAIGEPTLPAPLREYVEQRRNADPTTMEWVVFALAVPLIIAMIKSWIALFRFRWWARRATVGTSVAATMTLSFMGPTVEPGIATALNYASSMLFGAVLAMAYCSPAALWFDASRPSAGAVEQE